MNLDRLKDPFPPSDIEWRIQQASVKGDKPWAKVLAYVDARAVQDRLDEVCGPGNWKDEYSHLENGVICKLSIKIGDEWVTKQNGAPETNVESFKGGISKALVRAASTWGIGRYLYKLESQFAKIVNKQPDAHYAKVDGKEFYWIPPDLPSWALPEAPKPTPSTATKKDNQVVSHEKAAKQIFQIKGKPLAELKEYQIPLGKKYINQTLGSVPTEEIKSFLEWIYKQPKHSPQATDFIAHAEAYLEALDDEQLGHINL